MPALVCGLLIVLSAALPTVHAAESPDLLVKETTDKVLGELIANRDAMQADSALLYNMVDAIVLPHFDFERMSKLVLGKHWKNAEDAQRVEFLGEFKGLLVRTYATALFEYTGQEVVYRPFHATEDSTRVVVKTDIVPSDGPRIPIDYALSKGEDAAWKVYDIRIDGISMVTNYRSSYGKVIESKGMDSLISLLSRKREALSD